MIFGQQILHVDGDRRVGGEEYGDPQFAFDRIEKSFRLVRERIFLVARKIPSFVMTKGESIDHGEKEKRQDDLNNDTQPDLNAGDLF